MSIYRFPHQVVQILENQIKCVCIVVFNIASIGQQKKKIRVNSKFQITTIMYVLKQM